MKSGSKPSADSPQDRTAASSRRGTRDGQGLARPGFHAYSDARHARPESSFPRETRLPGQQRPRLSALEAFAKAHSAAPCDARIFYEYDQLMRRTGHVLTDRLANLEANASFVERRDDLSVELASLYNNLNQPGRALDLLLSREFQPWEGGEGLVLSQYVRANVPLAHRFLQKGEPPPAIASLFAASHPPENLSEAKHLLMNLSAPK